MLPSIWGCFPASVDIKGVDLHIPMITNLLSFLLVYLLHLRFLPKVLAIVFALLCSLGIPIVGFLDELLLREQLTKTLSVSVHQTAEVRVDPEPLEGLQTLFSHVSEATVQESTDFFAQGSWA